VCFDFDFVVESDFSENVLFSASERLFLSAHPDLALGMRYYSRVELGHPRTSFPSVTYLVGGTKSKNVRGRCVLRSLERLWVVCRCVDRNMKWYRVDGMAGEVIQISGSRCHECGKEKGWWLR
jgi:hypothetical protein